RWAVNCPTLWSRNRWWQSGPGRSPGLSRPPRPFVSRKTPLTAGVGQVTRGLLAPLPERVRPGWAVRDVLLLEEREQLPRNVRPVCIPSNLKQVRCPPDRLHCLSLLPIAKQRHAKAAARLCFAVGIVGLVKDLACARMGLDRLLEPAHSPKRHAEVVPRLCFAVGIAGLVEAVECARVGLDRLLEPALLPQCHAEVVPRSRFAVGVTGLLVQVAWAGVCLDRLLGPAHLSQHRAEVVPRRRLTEDITYPLAVSPVAR